MRVGVLTSSRADFGIYQPLIDELIKDNSFQIEIIAFGTHLSKFYGYTLDNINKLYSGIKVHKIGSLIQGDDEVSIATSFGLTVLKFADFWSLNNYNLVFCLGDRFEMAAAVQAGIPFNVKFSHIHGGETTLGAIDNIYRHQISLSSLLHFTSTKAYKYRVEELIECDENIFNVGALSLSNIKNFKPIKKEELFYRFNIKDEPFCLITFHPETNAFKKNEQYALEMRKALEEISKEINLVITMPNADTMGTIYRDQLYLLEKNNNNVFLIENFGKENYFSAMFYASFLLGNTSSGIIEAASFNKYVVNVGNRQKGRAQSNNVINSKFNHKDIIEASNKSLNLGVYSGENIYYKENSAKKIVNKIKNYEKL
ncbi:UDP-N-acetylglucosamine 2-epimerase [uncultured Tenacibaculum sp.]|uniref:UDP-N-acetylglucosamine 2-epimerase n=1 Tax=uncultured Tenacibaculum sp. TaxID=174713 RepID=UPI00261728C8|nr:UDP-N-acetylglucosamine 2-epimerase [uncultured Tenacibaculum sp.]